MNGGQQFWKRSSTQRSFGDLSDHLLLGDTLLHILKEPSVFDSGGYL
jgi:hypothetical protein